jgi:uncharacterized membrane protein
MVMSDTERNAPKCSTAEHQVLFPAYGQSVLSGRIKSPAATWLLGAGIVMAALAALAGLTDLLGDQRIRVLSQVWWHACGNVIVVLIEIYSWFIRYSEGTPAIVPVGLILSLIVVCILGFTGWMGWEMVYRHRVAVAGEMPTGTVTAASAPRRAA